MAFVLKKTATISWPVAVHLAADGGKFKKETFTAVFRELGREEFNRLLDEGKDEALSDSILVGWEGISDEDGNDMPFTKENKEALLDNFTVMKALIEAYGSMLQGAKVKN